MRLEVLVDQQEPLIFPLNKEKIIIGSGESCDILLEAPGVSRKHVVLHCNEDEFYIIDQGSTNGTFINEERLVPGKRVEFTSFFPVRIGNNVLLTLLSDEEAQDFALSSFNQSLSAEEVASEKLTRVIRPSELKEHTNLGINLHRKKASVRSKKAASKTTSGKEKKASKKKPEKNLNITVMLSAIIVMVAIYFQLNGEEEVVPQSNIEVARIGGVEPIQGGQEAVPIIPIRLVDKEFIKTPEELSLIQMDFKCVSNIEKGLCSSLNLSPPYGVTQVTRDIFIFAPIDIENKYVNSLNEILSLEEGAVYPIEIYAAHFFMNRSFDFTPEYSDYRVHLYFLDEEAKPFVGLSFYPSAYERFKETAPLNLLEIISKDGPYAVHFMKDLFVFH